MRKFRISYCLLRISMPVGLETTRRVSTVSANSRIKRRGHFNELLYHTNHPPEHQIREQTFLKESYRVFRCSQQVRSEDTRCFHKQVLKRISEIPSWTQEIFYWCQKIYIWYISALLFHSALRWTGRSPQIARSICKTELSLKGKMFKLLKHVMLQSEIWNSLSWVGARDANAPKKVHFSLL